MDIKQFIKLELSGWKTKEVVGLCFVFSIILINSIVFNDSRVAVMSAICGITYTIIAGKGKISCYLFGILSTLCYSYLSYKNGLYGNLILNMCYYFPMQIFGVFAWRKNLKKTTNEIIKTSLKKDELPKFIILTVVACFVTILALRHFGDSSPVFDGITTVMSLLGMYLTVKRCIEQWVVWIIVNGLSILMWLNIVLNGAKTLSTLVMWSVYFILGIYFYFQWKKEIKETSQAS